MRCLFALLMLLSGCATDLSSAGRIARVELDQEFLLPLNATVLVADSGYRLTFASVTEDSRCPMGVSCMWEGNARVVVRLDAIYDAAESFALELNTHPRFPASVSRGALRLQLRRLEPTPLADVPTTGYVATLLVTRP